MTCCCATAARSTIWMPSARSLAESFSLRSMRAHSRMVLSGVRSSWLTIAMNSSLARLASVAAAWPVPRGDRGEQAILGQLAVGVVAHDLDEAVHFAVTRRTDASTPLAQKRVPSLRICQRSSVARPVSSAWRISSSGTQRGAILGRE